MANVHPWFANVSIDQAAAWTADFFQEYNVDVAQTLANKPTMFIAETGWPTVRHVCFHTMHLAHKVISNQATLATLTTVLRSLLLRTSRSSWTPSSAKRTRTVPATSTSRCVFRLHSGAVLTLHSSAYQFFDEAWKDQQFGGVEGWWGLFTAKYMPSLSQPSFHGAHLPSLPAKHLRLSLSQTAISTKILQGRFHFSSSSYIFLSNIEKDSFVRINLGKTLPQGLCSSSHTHCCLRPWPRIALCVITHTRYSLSLKILDQPRQISPLAPLAVTSD